MESKTNKDLVISLTDARGLRDELSKLLTDLHELQYGKSKKDEVIQVEIVGGKFK
jgi:hypothetical protein